MALVLFEFALVLLEEVTHLCPDCFVLLFDFVDADVVLPAVVDPFENSWYCF